MTGETKWTASGYAFYGTWSVERGDIALPVLGPGGERPEDAESIARDIARKVNTYDALYEALEAAVPCLAWSAVHEPGNLVQTKAVLEQARAALVRAWSEAR